MNAHPSLMFPMPKGIPHDLRYPIVAYCHGKERNEVFCFTSDDAIKANPQDYAPHIVLDRPLDLTTLYVQLDDEGHPQEVLRTPTDPIDLNSELIMSIGVSSEHPLHYFVKHEDGHSSRHPYLYEMHIKEERMHDIYSSYMRDFDLPTEETLGEAVSLSASESDTALFADQTFMWIELGELPYTAKLISTDSADTDAWEGTLEVRYRDGQIWVSHENNPYGDDLYMRYDLDSIVSSEALLMRAMEKYSKTWASDENSAYEVYALNQRHNISLYTDRPIVELPTNLKTAYIQLDADGRTPKYASPKAQDLQDDSNSLVIFYWITDEYIILTHDDTPSNKNMNLFNRYRISELMS